MFEYEGYTIKQLNDEQLEVFQRIAIEAYPAMLPDNFSDEAKKGWLERMKASNKEDPKINYYGCFKGQKLVGGMIYFDYIMTLFTHPLDIGGIGLVCVDLLTRKVHAAKSIMKAFHDHYYSKGVTLTALYPFRPDFYAQMGYGLGKKMNKYKFTPENLPKTAKEHISRLDSSDKDQIYKCFNRYASKTHGMFQKQKKEFDRLISGHKVFGYKKEGTLQGFLAYRFKKIDPENFLLHDVIIEELIYENSEVLHELLTSLHSLADQISSIYFHTQDDFFHYLLHDPRNFGQKIFLTSQESNLQGLGIMYRIINVQKLFEGLSHHNFNKQSIKLKLTIDDDFLDSNSGSTVLHFNEGLCEVRSETDPYDVEIKLNIANFSSAFMGVIPFEKLYSLGLAKISNDDYLNSITKIFQTDFPPITTQQF
ncbi:MAG: GNAT family N-acetyltransferase [Candidatus Hodarchaeales archaeon]|jgi:predicted acetyltransferase